MPCFINCIYFYQNPRRTSTAAGAGTLWPLGFPSGPKADVPLDGALNHTGTPIRYRVYLPLAATGCFLLMGSMACTSNYGAPLKTPDPAPAPKPAVLPPTASLVDGQAQQFSVVDPSGSTATPIWAVLPPTGGTITATGLFTASGVPGAYTIQVTVASVTATAKANILTPPPPMVTSPNYVQASGSLQSSADGFLHVASVLNETIIATQAQDATGYLQLRSGFLPAALTAGGSLPSVERRP